ncbi:S-layer homology domain-containing protein [Schinkia azotoformans]|uniref:SLH domain-containing protein n=1 Tax=Schinkia azotoformans LMG 9581 TaxID=1131731 RepID=K6DQM5_SCHAZ|nr:S-layer homology domain-containing protein [Schinkia azotoformans]EKN63086.1 hypothetical protein BAZO_18958 [Schinkia azotoformans LMG 9581]MEC1640448.1 S-layer homology domain-containing protein [Schinkia azotoformans]MEC1723038.1 S-layer homology domain-containing protein [Schinkia azotoformans]MEC1944667.1 S-layer homology domain-containing protein [Schinkia azotoformans]MED4414309.1 S-layer homology domain-containing protein [Schinkia azotoformans]
MNKKLINVLSTSFLIMGLATGCGMANNEAGNDRGRTNLTPVGYDNNTRYAPLNVTDTVETPNVNNGGTVGANNNGDGASPDPALNPNENADGDGDGTDTNNDTPGTGTVTDPGVDTTPGTNDETPATDGETGEKTETQTPGENQANKNRFADVPENNPYSNDIHAARDLGLMNGVGNDKFGLGTTLTREQMASIMMKAVRQGYLNVDNTNNGTK